MIIITFHKSFSHLHVCLLTSFAICYLYLLHFSSWHDLQVLFSFISQTNTFNKNKPIPKHTYFFFYFCCYFCRSTYIKFMNESNYCSCALCFNSLISIILHHIGNLIFSDYCFYTCSRWWIYRICIIIFCKTNEILWKTIYRQIHNENWVYIWILVNILINLQSFLCAPETIFLIWLNEYKRQTEYYVYKWTNYL